MTQALTLPGNEELSQADQLTATARQWIDYLAAGIQQNTVDSAELQSGLVALDSCIQELQAKHGVAVAALMGMKEAITLLVHQRDTAIQGEIEAQVALERLNTRVRHEVEVAWSEGAMHVMECGDCAMAAEREADVENMANRILDEGPSALEEYLDEAASRAKEALDLAKEWAKKGKDEFIIDGMDETQLVAKLNAKIEAYHGSGDAALLEAGDEDPDDDDFEDEE